MLKVKINRPEKEEPEFVVYHQMLRDTDGVYKYVGYRLKNGEYREVFNNYIYFVVNRNVLVLCEDESILVYQHTDEASGTEYLFRKIDATVSISVDIQE